MDFIIPQEQKNREAGLLAAYFVACDNANTRALINAWDAVVTYYNGAGCPSPDMALLAVLLIYPPALVAVRDVVTAEMLPRYNDAKLYTAILSTPVTGTLAEWWLMLAKVSGLSIADITAYLTYDYYDATQIAVYAATLRATHLHARAFDIARRMIATLYDGDSRGIDSAINALEELRGVSPQSAPRRWSASFSHISTKGDSNA